MTITKEDIQELIHSIISYDKKSTYEHYMFLAKPNYKSKDGTIKKGLFIKNTKYPNGIYIAPKDDML